MNYVLFLFFNFLGIVSSTRYKRKSTTLGIRGELTETALIPWSFVKTKLLDKLLE